MISGQLAIVDDHEVARLGLENTLSAFPQVSAVAQFESVAQLLDSARHFDLVLLDLRLSDGTDPYDNAVAVQSAGMDVLVYSALDSPYLLRRVMSAGVKGVVAKTAPVAQLQEAVTTVLSGGGGDLRQRGVGQRNRCGSRVRAGEPLAQAERGPGTLRDGGERQTCRRHDRSESPDSAGLHISYPS